MICSNCDRPIIGSVKRIDGEPFCQKCAAEMDAVIGSATVGAAAFLASKAGMPKAVNADRGAFGGGPVPPAGVSHGGFGVGLKRTGGSAPAPAAAPVPPAGVSHGGFGVSLKGLGGAGGGGGGAAGVHTGGRRKKAIPPADAMARIEEARRKAETDMARMDMTDKQHAELRMKEQTETSDREAAEQKRREDARRAEEERRRKEETDRLERLREWEVKDKERREKERERQDRERAKQEQDRAEVEAKRRAEAEKQREWEARQAAQRAEEAKRKKEREAADMRHMQAVEAEKREALRREEERKREAAAASAPPPVPPRASLAGVAYATSMWDYEAQNDDEVGFDADSRVVVDEECIGDLEGWWRVTVVVTGKSGLAPANYFEREGAH